MKLSNANDDDGTLHAAAACSQNIAVFCRLKPRPPSEVTCGSFIIGDEKTICVNQTLTPSTPQEHTHKATTTKTSLLFTFDHVYDEESSQELLFEGVGKPLVEAVCNGVNATVLAYGTTASGKTYTMVGARTASAGGQPFTTVGTCIPPLSASPDRPATELKIQQVGVRRGVSIQEAPGTSTDEYGHWGCAGNGTPSRSYKKTTGALRPEDGLLPRMIYHLFDCLERRQKMMDKGCVKAASMEVYNDSIVDLTTGRGGLKVHKPKFGQVSVVGLHEEVLPGPEAAIAFLERVLKGRKTAPTCVNAESSRSHFVFWLVLQGTDAVTGTCTTTRLSVVDLAGSERLVKTNACGNLQVEGAMINKSLTCLGKVITCLAALNEAPNGRASGSSADDGEGLCSVPQYEKAHFIPYRDSKLTRVLQDSLGGNSRTSILLTCSQDATYLAENIATLRFGQRSRSVKNSPKTSVAPQRGGYDLQKDIHRYQNYIRALTSWGETAIVRLSDSTRSPSVKQQQRIPVSCKRGVPSRRLDFKRVNASTPCFTKELKKDERQAEVVEELLSGFPAPPKALQLDFTKDAMASKIRSRLQLDENEARGYLVASVDVLAMCTGPAVDTKFAVAQRSAGLTEEENGAPVMLVKKTVECTPMERRQTHHSSVASICHTPISVSQCNSHLKDILCKREHSSTPSATEEASRLRADSSPVSREGLLQQCDDTEPGPSKLAFSQRQSGKSCVCLRLAPDCNKDHSATQRSDPLFCRECARHVTTHRVRHVTPENTSAQLVIGEQSPTFWKVAWSWLSNVERIQYLLVRRARKIDMLRRAAQHDDRIRFKQNLSSGE